MTSTSAESRPLVITDCDEVLLHMAAPFGDWLAEAHQVIFARNEHDFSRAMTYAETGEPVPTERVWALLGGFFDTEMGRQQPIAGALEAMAHLAARGAEVVVLTNLEHHRNAARTEQLATHGLNFRVFTNQGPKGPALRAILDEYRPSRALFIDDLPQHHGSAATDAPELIRLHLCGDPQLAPRIPCAHAAGHAHARIDTWAHALPWIESQLFDTPEG